MTLLDAVMREWHWCETYGAWFPTAPDESLDAMRQVPPNEIRMLRTMIELRNLPGRLVGKPRFGEAAQGSVPLFEQLLSFGFCSLGDEADEAALGLIDQSWKVSGGLRADVDGPTEFATFAEPGYVKVCVNIAARPARGGAFVSTQTRVLATDARTRRLFRAYWLFIRPFSGLTRRSWLAAAKRRL